MLRTAVHRFVVRQRLEDLAYLANGRQLRTDLGRRLDDLCRRGVRSGWTTHTSAAVAASVWIWQLTQSLEHERRMRIGRAILAQERRGIGALDWLGEFDSDRMNVVGEDVFLLRFNYTNGMLAEWSAKGKPLDPAARRLFLAMAAWGLAGMEPAEVDQRFEELVAEFDG